MQGLPGGPKALPSLRFLHIGFCGQGRFSTLLFRPDHVRPHVQGGVEFADAMPDSVASGSDSGEALLAMKQMVDALHGGGLVVAASVQPIFRK